MGGAWPLPRLSVEQARPPAEPAQLGPPRQQLRSGSAIHVERTNGVIDRNEFPSSAEHARQTDTTFCSLYVEISHRANMP
jgi:hypothetical protein